MKNTMAQSIRKYPGIFPGKKEGTYRIDYYDWDGTRRTKTINGNQTDAVKLRRFLLAKVDRIKNGLEQPPNKNLHPLSFSKLWNKFYSEYQLKVDSGSIEQASLDRYNNSINALFDYDASLERKIINQITWKDFEEYKIYRISKGFSPHGINTNLRNIKTIFRYAVKNKYLAQNPLDKVDRVKTTLGDARYLNEEEVSNLKNALIKLDLNDPFQKDAHDLTIFYLYTGARTSEALYPNFSWDCVYKNKIVFPETKMSRERIIPLTNSIDNILESRKHIIGGPFFYETSRITNTLDENDQKQLTKDMVYNRTKFVFEKAGLPKVSTHTLRKTAGAYYYMATKDIFAASRFLGHSSVKVTESHYVGLIQSLQTEYSNKFEHFLTNI